MAPPFNPNPDSFTFEDLDQLLLLLKEQYQIDFSRYAKSSLKRRFQRLLDMERITYQKLRLKLATQELSRQFLLNEITVNVSEFFRDPFFYRSLNEKVIRQIPSGTDFHVWCAGCSAGQEVISLAVLLHEQNLLQPESLIGSDINPIVIEQARSGKYALGQVMAGTKGYEEAGGKNRWSDYYRAHYQDASFTANLLQNIRYTEHDLVQDKRPGKFDLICCRNVNIYFETELQEEIIDMFFHALNPGGFLCIGSKESIRFTRLSPFFDLIDREAQIYRKKYD